ncbi:ChbG/HpnK family deacetylase [Candidatus Pelagibacter sp.]|nr:ChbG/HpnK family deacetylase [Candidatus Pelagibacter sp.]
MNKKIYFHADDFGRSQTISKNIYKCIQLKNINSISVMMGFDDSYFDKIKKNHNVKLKLHLNLTESYKGSSLKDDYSFLKLLLLRFNLGFFLHKKKIKVEIEKQIVFFKKKFKVNKIRIDSHEHVHVIPWINELLLSLKKKHKIIELRDPIENYYFVSLKDFLNIKYLNNLTKFSLIYFLRKFHNKNKSELFNTSFTGLFYTGFQDFKTISKGISHNIRDNKYLEVLIHPGYTNYSEINLFKRKYFLYYSSKNRIKEYKIASSKKIKKFLI